jgi:hypothetical protein
MILALKAANSPSVLCRTLRCGLSADMILQNNQHDLPKKKIKIQKDQILVSSKTKSGSITVVNWIFPKKKLHLARIIIQSNIIPKQVIPTQQISQICTLSS